jgi:hypothetical protein
MDVTPRGLGRWLPSLGGAIVLESPVSLAPTFIGAESGFYTCLAALVHMPHVVLLLASCAVWFLPALAWTFQYRQAYSSRAPMLLWHGVVQVTLTLIVTVLVALALERPAMPFQPRKEGPMDVAPPPPPADLGPIDVPSIFRRNRSLHDPFIWNFYDAGQVKAKGEES